MLQRVAVFALAAGGLFAFTAPGTAQHYPSRTVTIIVPYPAGGPTDQTARMIANFAVEETQPEFHRRERHRRRHHHRHQPRRQSCAGWLHAAAAQSADFRQRHAVQESAVRHRRKI